MENVIDIERLEKYKQKIDMYNNEEINLYNSLYSNFRKLNSIVKIKSFDNLNVIQNDLIRKIKKINDNHKKESLLLFKNINKYEYTAKNVAEKLGDIGG